MNLNSAIRGFLFLFIKLTILISITNQQQQQQDNVKIIAKGLEEFIMKNNFIYGCIGLIIDYKMNQEDRQFMLSIRFLLKKSLTSVMIVSSDQWANDNYTLCHKHATLMVGPFASPYVKRNIRQFLGRRDLWSFKTWLLLLPPSSTYNRNLLPYLELHLKMDIEYDSFILIFNDNQILQIYRQQQMDPIKTHLIGEYINTKDEFLWNFHGHRINLNGMLLKIASNNISLSRIYTNNKTGELILADGVYERVWHVLEDMLNFTTKIVKTDKHGWYRYPLPMEGWTGIERLLLDKEVDAVVTGVRDSPRKRKDLFLTHPIHLRRYSIYVRDPDDSIFIIPWDIFTAPFSLNLWLAIVITILVIAIVLFLMAQLCGRYIWPMEAKRYTFINCLFSIYRAFCNQGQEDDPKALSTRIIYITTYLTAMVILASYSGVLISFLTLGRATLPLDSLEQIYKDGTYQLGVKTNTSAHIYFLNAAEDEVASKIFIKQILNDPENIQDTYEGGFNRICQLKYALLVGLEVETKLNAYPCKILRLERDFANFRITLAFHKHFRFTKLFDKSVHDLLDNGILSKINVETLTNNRLKNNAIISPSVDITQVAPLLIELTIAICLSIIGLLIESLIRIIRKSSKIHIQQQQQKQQNYKKSIQLKRWPQISLPFL